VAQGTSDTRVARTQLLVSAAALL